MKRLFSTLLLTALTAFVCSAAPANLKQGSQANFQSLTQNKLVFVDFYADWCGPCRAFAPAFKHAASKLPGSTFIKVNVDNNRSLSAKYSVRYIPHIVALRNGKVVEKFKGSRTAAAFTAWCKRLAGNGNTPPDPDNTSTSAADNNNLPTYIYVWTKGYTVVNQAYDGMTKKKLPIANHYKGSDGVYVAVYSRNKEGSIYSVSREFHVMGMIRVKGEYIGRIAHPAGWKNKDISAAQKFKDLANKYFFACKGGGWVGGDTGGFLGSFR